MHFFHHQLVLIRSIFLFQSVDAGATSGIGAETARVLASRGARLVLPARSLKAAEEIKTRIVSEFPNSTVVVMPLDLSSLDSVRRFVSDFLALDLPLHLLMYKLTFVSISDSVSISISSHQSLTVFIFFRNNAGKFSHGHSISEDGVEMTFATNYLGI